VNYLEAVAAVKVKSKPQIKHQQLLGVGLKSHAFFFKNWAEFNIPVQLFLKRGFGAPCKAF